MNKQDSFRERAKIMALVLAALLAVHMANLLLGGTLLYFGIQPRDIGSIYTIGTAPFIHGDFAHLGNNMVGIAIFGFLCLLRGVRYFLEASAIIIVLTGLLVWLFGREATHIGASGWLFGLWSMAIALAWFESTFDGMKGRIERDKWVAQARIIVTEGLMAFRERAKTNDY